jgi:hypothetical protein
MSNERELTAFDIANWALKYKWLFALCLVGGLGWAIFNVTSPKPAPAPSTFEIHVSAFPSGNSLVGRDEIVSYIDKLTADLYTGSSASANATKSYTLKSSENIQPFKAAVEKLEAELVADAARTLDVVKPLYNSNDVALSVYLAADRFMTAYQAGKIDLIQVESVEVPPITRSNVGQVVMPIATGLIAFLMLALGLTFAQRLRAHNSSKNSTTKQNS